MGMAFFKCESQGCSATICDAGPYFCCGACGHNLCDNCAKEYKAGKYSSEPWPVDEEGYEYDGDDRGCPFCKVEEVSDDTLFNFALGSLGVSKEELIQRYKEQCK
jgi:hypothetical protein